MTELAASKADECVRIAEKRQKAIDQKKVYRYTEKDKRIIVDTVCSYLKIGYTLSKACEKAMVKYASFNIWVKRMPKVKFKVLLAKDKINDTARGVIIQSLLRGDTDTAKWWLEKKQSDEFGKRADLNINTATYEISEEKKKQLEEMLIKQGVVY